MRSPCAVFQKLLVVPYFEIGIQIGFETENAVLDFFVAMSLSARRRTLHQLPAFEIEEFGKGSGFAFLAGSNVEIGCSGFTAVTTSAGLKR